MGDYDQFFEDGASGPESLLSDWPDKEVPPSPLKKTPLQESIDKLKRDCEKIEARKRKEKIMSGSLEDIRERLTHG